MAAFGHGVKRVAGLGCGALACLLVVLASPAAKADRIFVLDDVSFGAGQTATGTFTLNVYGYLSSWNIDTSNGAHFSGYDYTPSINTQINNPQDTVITFNRDDPAYDGYLKLTFADPLTGPLPLELNPLVLGGASYECDGYERSNGACPSGDQRNIVQGGALAPGARAGRPGAARHRLARPGGRLPPPQDALTAAPTALPRLRGVNSIRRVTSGVQPREARAAALTGGGRRG